MERAIYGRSPEIFATELLGFRPAAFQSDLLQPYVKKALLCCHRGAGKTEVIAIRAAHHCVSTPGALILVASETAEKAAELIERAVGFLDKAGYRLRRDKYRRHGVRLENGARLLPVPSRAGAVRGYPATMVVIDEAACVPDEVYTALRGTRAATSTSSTFWVMSTPGARRGFFYDLWTAADVEGYWTRVHLSAVDSGRVTPEFLAEERRQMHPDDFAREYLAEFGDTRRSLFREADVRAAIRPGIPLLGENNRYWPISGEALFKDGTRMPDRGYFFAVDLGQAQDQTVIAVVDYQLLPTGRRDPVYLTWEYEMKLRLRWLEMLPVETPYTEVGRALRRLLGHFEVNGRAQVIVDATGVGRAVYDQLKVALRGTAVRGVQITGGAAVSSSGELLNVPKAEIALNLEGLLRDGCFEIAERVPHLEELVRQMFAFERVRLAGGGYGYSGKAAGRDDLVMAVGLGVGWAYQRYGSAFRRKAA